MESYKDMTKDLDINLEEWIEDTDGFSIAHLKELFTGVVIFETPYEDVIYILQGRFDKVTSTHDGRKVGFGKPS